MGIQRLHNARHPAPRAAFTMAEMLVVMAIITILAASLAVVLPGMRTRAMSARAGADIAALGTALDSYKDDIGYYPVAPYRVKDSSGTWVNSNALVDAVLFDALTNRDEGGENRGWAGASSEWSFIHGTVEECDETGCDKPNADNIKHYSDNGVKHQLLDPWGLPYYYIAHPDYLRGVQIYDPSNPADSKPVVYGSTETPNDFWTKDGDDRLVPDQDYYGPPPKREEFFNANSFQIHSKGPDQATDARDGYPNQVDACDRGCDPDDINNFGQ
jgi:prepilin-type N-terminal cleavage/methylation domain-containing protein